VTTSSRHSLESARETGGCERLHLQRDEIIAGSSPFLDCRAVVIVTDVVEKRETRSEEKPVSRAEEYKFSAPRPRRGFERYIDVSSSFASFLLIIQSRSEGRSDPCNEQQRETRLIVSLSLPFVSMFSLPVHRSLIQSRHPRESRRRTKQRAGTMRRRRILARSRDSFIPPAEYRFCPREGERISRARIKPDVKIVDHNARGGSNKGEKKEGGQRGNEEQSLFLLPQDCVMIQAGEKKVREGSLV